MYKPNPIDTSGIEIPEDLKPLVEEIAKNVHEVWSKSRIEQGWVCGEVKDSVKKTTPCLVPYEELSEEEKDYDRHTALETIKVVMKLGYKIKK